MNTQPSVSSQNQDDQSSIIKKLQDEIKAQEAERISVQQALENTKRQLKQLQTQSTYKKSQYSDGFSGNKGYDADNELYDSDNSKTPSSGGSANNTNKRLKSKKKNIAKKSKKDRSILSKSAKSSKFGKDAADAVLDNRERLDKKRRMPVSRWLLHQLGEPNFIKVHYIYIMLWIFISSGFLMIPNNISYIDALFMASSACTQGGMNT